MGGFSLTFKYFSKFYNEDYFKIRNTNFYKQYSPNFVSSFYCKISIDSQEVAKIVQKSPVYSVLSFPQFYVLFIFHFIYL